MLIDFPSWKSAFIKKAGSRWYTLELEAIDNLTLEHITCQCPVLGVWQSGLIVLHDGKPRAVGESQVHHNLYPICPGRVLMSAHNGGIHQVRLPV
jgi:inner membrane protein